MGKDEERAIVIYGLTSNFGKKMEELRGFAPIGMLEFWNIGILGTGIMEWWV
jgi:hypothetical protein